MCPSFLELTLLSALCLPLAGAWAGSCQHGFTPHNPDSIYTVHGDGTVTDTRTGLMWKQCPEGQTYAGGSCSGSSTPMNWVAALTLAKNASFAGYSDWRLPNIKELHSLVEPCRQAPSLNDTVFSGNDQRNIWSSTPATHPNIPFAIATSVSFQVGSALSENRANPTQGAWLVRAGQSLAPVPVVSAVTLAGPAGNTGATITATSVQNGSAYWVAVPAGAPAPTPAQVRAGQDYGGITLAASGSQVMLGGVSTPLNVGGLAGGTAYELYLVVEVDGQWSAPVRQLAFTTTTPLNGVCGSARNTAAAIAPASALCSPGSPTPVTGNGGQWAWGCNGSNGGISTAANACTAPYAGQTLSLSANPATLWVGASSSLTASSSGAGLVIDLSATGPCTLSGSTVASTGPGICSITASQPGTGDAGTSRYLAAPNVRIDIAISPTPIDAVCGSHHGQTLTSAPTLLCSAGSAGSLSGSGSPWSWTCIGQHGGGNASCSATLQTYVISTSTSPAGAGNVQCTPNPAPHGGQASCTATAQPGYQFSAWGGACSGAGACTLTGITAAQAVQAQWAKQPLLGSVELRGSTPTSATLAVTSDTAAGGWWLAVPDASPAPTAAQVKAQPDDYGSTPIVTVLAKGRIASLQAGQAQVFQADGLQPGIAYALYAVAEDTGGLLSAPASIRFGTPALDTAPDTFSFTPQTGVALASSVQSNAITISGINAPAVIDIADGEYQIGSAAWSSAAASITQGEQVRVRHTSSSSHAATVTTTLAIGGVQGRFTSTTLAALPVDPIDPVEPEPTPLPDGLSITGPGMVPIKNPSQPIVITPGAGGAVLVLPGSGTTPVALNMQINGAALGMRALPGLQLAVAPVPGQGQGVNVLVLQVLQGWAELTASHVGQPLALAGSVLLSSGTADTRIEGRPLSTGVLAGALLPQAGSLPELGSPGLLRGERLRIDAEGRIQAVELGTLGAQPGAPGLPNAAVPAPGDALIPPALGTQIHFQATPVQLASAANPITRLQGTTWLQLLDGHAQALGQALAPGAPTQARIDGQGLITLRLGPWTAALAPLSAITIDTRRPDALSYTPDGLIQITRSGLSLTLAPTLADWPGFAQALAALSPEAQVQVTAQGVLLLQDNGQRWALRPALLAQDWHQEPDAPTAQTPGATALPHLTVDTSGTLTLQGTQQQRLLWALADYTTARTLLAQALPGTADVATSLNPEGALQVLITGEDGTASHWQLRPQPQLHPLLLDPAMAALLPVGQHWTIDTDGTLLLRLPAGVQRLHILPAGE